MVLNVLYIISIVAFIIVISFIIKKRKKAGISGIKSALTPICFLLISLINILGYWFNFIGLLTSFITFLLLILAAYFTKYLPTARVSI
ncbi:hypothetical protein [Oceanobacillus kimchii]|uniref:hypothetical protein n=1 Tax=Oceanobacillus kimchii TaxID=746691 RepID=UPI0009840D9B|nr:hypothetical protein [Oceanobacillus kimchii]